MAGKRRRRGRGVVGSEVTGAPSFHCRVRARVTRRVFAIASGPSHRPRESRTAPSKCTDKAVESLRWEIKNQLGG